jgi:hypothetical protein
MFQHVFAQVPIKGRMVSFDPTPEEAIAGWESKGMGSWTFPIYDRGDPNDPYNLGNTNMGIVPLVIAGIKIAPIAIGLISNLFGAGKRKADETKAHDAYGAVVTAVDQIETAVKAGQMSPAQGRDQYAQVRAAYINFQQTQINVDSVKRAMVNQYDPSRCEYICATDTRIAKLDSLAPAQIQAPPPMSTVTSPAPPTGTLAPTTGTFGGGGGGNPTYSGGTTTPPATDATSGVAGLPWWLIAVAAIAAIMALR